MIITIEALFAFAALLAGYAAVTAILDDSDKTVYQKAVALDGKRIAYLVIGIIFSFALVILFNAEQHLELVTGLLRIGLFLIVLPAAAVDLSICKIPNQFLLVGLILRGILLVAEVFVQDVVIWQLLVDIVVGALIPVLFFLLMRALFKNSIGMGDVKLFGLTGLYLGLEGNLGLIFYTLIIAFVVALFLLISKKKGRKDSIPFGPCILLGTFLTLIISGI